MTITSPTNPAIKRLVRLRSRRGRDAESRFVVEGARELGRALAGGADIEAIYVCPELHNDAAAALAEQLAEGTTPMTLVGRAAFEKASGRQGPDGVLGVAVQRDLALQDVRVSSRPLILVADGIEKPGNLGTMLRTAATAGADAVVVTNPATDIYNPGVVRTSQGALFALQVAVAPAHEASAWLAANGIAPLPADPGAGMRYWDADLTGPVAIVVGSEHSGVSDVWMESGRAISIPMMTGGDSLNASAAAAVVLFEAVRQRSRLAEHPDAVVG